VSCDLFPIQEEMSRKKGFFPALWADGGACFSGFFAFFTILSVGFWLSEDGGKEEGAEELLHAFLVAVLWSLESEHGNDYPQEGFANITEKKISPESPIFLTLVKNGFDELAHNLENHT